MMLACPCRCLEVMGAGKNGVLARDKRGDRKLACLPRTPGSFLRPLLTSVCYAGYRDVKEDNLSPRLLV